MTTPQQDLPGAHGHPDAHLGDAVIYDNGADPDAAWKPAAVALIDSAHAVNQIPTDTAGGKESGLSPQGKAALAYATQLGWSIIPLHAPDGAGCSCRRPECANVGKHPRTPQGVKDASTDPQQVARWWADWPNANIGVATGAVSGIVAVDIDSDDGLAAFTDLTGGLPTRTPTQSTGRGHHLLFAPPIEPVRGHTRVLPGVDLRSDGNYIVVAPSVHKSGRAYSWEIDPLQHSLAPFPAQLSAKVRHSARVGYVEARVASSDTIPEGLRNDMLTAIAGSIRRRGGSENVIYVAISADNEERCQPPLPDSEIRTIARSIGNRPVTPMADLPRSGRSDLRALRLEDVHTIESPKWLVDGLIPERSLVVVYGEPGVGKSFLTLDLVLSIGAGTPFHGRCVLQGQALYVAAEGSAGLSKRVRAWEAAHPAATNPAVLVVPEPVVLTDDRAVGRLLDLLRDLCPAPRLIAFDTLARCFAGDENTAADMNLVIAGCDRIRRELGSAVLLDHHSGKPNGRRRGAQSMRGSSALPGAADTILAVTKAAGVVTVRCEKQKDSECFDAFALRLTRSAESCVLIPDKQLERRPDDGLTATARDLLRNLVGAGTGNEVTSGDWEQASGLATTTFNRARRELEARTYVNVQRLGRRRYYTATGDGLMAIGAMGANHVPIEGKTDCQVGSTPSPSLGGSGPGTNGIGDPQRSAAVGLPGRAAGQEAA